MRFFRILAAASCLLAFMFVSLHASAQTSSWPPAPVVKLAVNPVTNKVYVANTASNTVSAYDATTGTSTSIGVGGGPAFIAINPVTNLVYVDNVRDASLSVIDGATDSLIATYAIGSSGPIAIDPLHNMVYIVRLTGTSSDEVTYFNGATNNWYTAATSSFQPIAVAVNPITQTIYVAHYGTGDVRVISGVYNTAPGGDFPASTAIGMGTHPTAIAVNPVTNKVYVISENASGSIAVINGATNTAVFPAIASGHALAPKSLAVNPVNNNIYAAFANEVIVIDGASNALTYIPITGASSGAVSLAIDYIANRIYAATELGTLIEIDGDNNSVVSTTSIASGTSSIGVNPATGTVLTLDTALATRARSSGATAHSNALVTSVTPLPGNTSGANGSVTLNVGSTFAAGLPAMAVYYRFDSPNGPWSVASGRGPYTVPLTGLSAGSHSLFAFAVDGQHAPFATSPGSMPLIGGIATYAFTIQSASAAVSLVSSANPAAVGQAVTFTASVTGSAGTPTGTVTFKDGATTLCSAIALASGSATCSTSTLTAGSHSITAQYSGDGTYRSATSASLSQAINKASATMTLASSANPSMVGQTVTFTATVAGSSGAPTGTVTFQDGGTTLCGAVPVSSGRAACATSALSAGSHPIVASYSGDAQYNTASSTPLSQSVNTPARVDPTVALSTSSNPATAGQPVTFTASVSGGAGTPGGTATFLDNGNFIQGCAGAGLSAGTATCVTSTLAAGRHSISVQYSGDATYNPATSPALSQDVAAAAGELVTRYRLYSPATLEHLYTSDPVEYAYLSNRIDPNCCGWTAEGPIYRIFNGPNTYGGISAVPEYRLYNPNSHQHHWTTDANEYNYLAALGWAKEGMDGYILPSQASGTVPLHRLYLNAQGGLHLWTIDPNEVNALTTSGGWVHEGVAGYVVALR